MQFIYDDRVPSQNVRPDDLRHAVPVGSDVLLRDADAVPDDDDAADYSDDDAAERNDDANKLSVCHNTPVGQHTPPTVRLKYKSSNMPARHTHRIRHIDLRSNNRPEHNNRSSLNK